MPRIVYDYGQLRPATREVIMAGVPIIQDYRGRDIQLNLRTLWYRYVALGLLPASWIDPRYNAKKGLPLDTKNTEKNYKRLGDYIKKAREHGLIDWDDIKDLTRRVEKLSHWDNPGKILVSAASSYNRDLWVGQECKVELWMEKVGLSDILRPVCHEFDIPMYGCKGYNSSSMAWQASRRMLCYKEQGYKPVILHIGDHDPSGVDMTRDIRDRLSLYAGGVGILLDSLLDLSEEEQEVLLEGEDFEKDGKVDVIVDRLALNWDQIHDPDVRRSLAEDADAPMDNSTAGQYVRHYVAHGPSRDPAKASDPRSTGYEEKYGEFSWELDVLDPAILVHLVREGVGRYVDQELLEKQRERQELERDVLRRMARNWPQVVKQFGGEAEEENTDPWSLLDALLREGWLDRVMEEDEGFGKKIEHVLQLEEED